MKILKRFKRMKYKSLFGLIIIGLLTISSLLLINITKSELLQNGVEVEPNSELVYYLEVTYDGVDKYGLLSNDTTISKVYSDYIYVEDKIPEGLTFQNFVTLNYGTIGAVRRDDETKSCTGGVYDDTGPANETETEITYRGLHYNKETRTVTFKVSGMQAGCKLVVGIVTKTPATRPKTRIDFYNNANAIEGSESKISNTVHAFMGPENAQLYNVTYEYTGEIPENVPALPQNLSYAAGASVGVIGSPNLEGYKFSGWTTSDVEVTDDVFTMPEKEVKFTGTFEELPKYKVVYSVENMPEGYILPLEKEYYPNSTVNLDSLSIGDIFNDYEFKGWTIDGIEISDNTFIMPERDVIVNGKFEIKKYKVEYQFTGDILPENSESLLPSVSYYKPGENISLEEIIDIDGYHFLGWYKEDNFEMPSEDIVILGEWSIRNGFFEPDIKIEIVNNKFYYKKGDIVDFKITVTNNAEFPIKDITVIENNSKAKFNNGNGYTIDTERMISIETIEASGNVIINAEYEVTDNDTGIVNNEVEILGALADNYYELNPDKNYKASISFNIYAKLNICNTIDKVTNSTYEYHITSSDYDTWISVEANNCKSIYLKNEEYKIRELVPQDNEVDNETKTITVSDNSEIAFTNTYKKKGFYKSNGEVKNIVEPSTLNKIISKNAIIDNIKSEYVAEETGIKFGSAASQKSDNLSLNGYGTYIRAGTENDEYPIIYYRGTIDNNNVLFAGFCWQILRTTENGGIKLIYNGIPQNGICNNNGNVPTIGTSKYNEQKNGVGYMYTTTTTDDTSSLIKLVVDEWYENNLINYTNYLEDAVWCNDRSILEVVSGTIRYGSFYTNTSLNTTLKDAEVCPNKEDRFTVDDLVTGNGKLTYPIGLITSSEAIIAGLAYQNATSSYLTGNSNWWTMTPVHKSTNANNFIININGLYSGTAVFGSFGVRPAISLKNGTLITDGDGTPNNPYIVE